jgi:peptide-methionine (S)-S-oxide reductase
MIDSKKSDYTLLASLIAFALLFLIGYGARFHGSLPLAAADVTQEQTDTPAPGLQRATFAAGCFWSMEAIFKQLRGVSSVYPGYAGGTVAHPSYDLVETGTTGYAETVNITYDPKRISYTTLLKVLLTVRDPTTLNQQGNDVGTNYRSIIFYRTAAEKAAADADIQQINAEHIWPNPIVTEVRPFTTFYRAEGYHLNYYALHPYEPYCALVIAPEISNFREKYPELLKS